MPSPTYQFRAGFASTNWTEVFSNYSTANSGWLTVEAGFKTWEELAAGPVPIEDLSAVRIGRRRATVFERLRSGDASFFLDNFNGDYSPEANTLVRPNVDVTLKAQTSVGSVYSLFVGKIEGAQLDGELSRRQVRIDAVDRSFLLKRNVELVLKENTKTASLATDVLSTVGIRAEMANIDSNLNDDIELSFIDNISAGEAFNDIVRAGAYFLTVPGDGRITLTDRNFDVLRSIVGSYDATSTASGESFLNLTYSQNDESIINDVRIAALKREATSVSTIGFLQTTPSIPASNQSISFFVEYLDPATNEPTPVNSVITPVVSADYTFNTIADGTGTDVTSDGTVTFTNFARTALVEITNTTTVTMFVTKFQVRGTPLQLKPPFLARSNVSSSSDRYGSRTFGIDNDLVSNLNFAQNYAEFMAATFSDPIPHVFFSLKNTFPDILANDLLSLIHVNDSNSSYGSDSVVTAVQHFITLAKGLEHTSQYEIEKKVTKNFLLLDEDPEGKLDTDRTWGF